MTATMRAAVDVKASRLEPTTLASQPLSALCFDFLHGFCQRGTSCTYSHQICAVDDGRAHTLANSPPNVLTLAERSLHLSIAPFDNVDGPGELSAYGPRHDNDHVDICNIIILPTTDEILSRRLPYIPQKAPESKHHLPLGRKRHLDILFRQLRFDRVEAWIDICYHASQALYSNIPHVKDYDERMTTPRRVRYHLFQDVSFEEVWFHETKGLLFRLSFACPKVLKGRKLESTKTLEEGMLIALIGLSVTGDLSTTFLEVFQRQTTGSMSRRTGDHSRAAVILNLAEPGDTDASRRLLYYKGSILKGRFSLAEIPGTLYPSFSHTLRRLQDQFVSDEDFAFQSLVAPSTLTSEPTLSPPTYTEDEDFHYRLDCLCPENQKTTGESFTIKPQDLLSDPHNMSTSIRKVEELTSLDQGQASALCENLCRGFAFTQGPPGTGKTFLGVALAKVLLASRGIVSQKPILVVCLTNHALDSFLKDLHDAGIDSFARLGGQSKEAWIHKYELKSVIDKKKKSAAQKRALRQTHLQCEGLYTEGVSWCASLNGDCLSWPAVQQYLQGQPTILRSFTDLEYVGQERLSDIRLARKAGGFAYEYWCSGGDLKDVELLLQHFNAMAGDCHWIDPSEGEYWLVPDRVSQDIRDNINALNRGSMDVWAMSLKEREDMLCHWRDEIDARTIFDSTAEIHRRHQAAIMRKRDAYDEADLNTLAGLDIIGMTTTVCARQWSTLKQLGAQIVICEEAGEVMEAQFLCALLPTIQHAISIGDPQQLRPQIDQPSLSIESDIGSAYRLDESLMERLMLPSNAGVVPLEASRLNLQRRMHPHIAGLMRATLYPYLQDHDCTKQRSPVPGMADRVWWLNHREPEDPPNLRSNTPNSFSNSFEVEMIAGLVEYLVNSNEYDYRDITVLTPYNGQLAAFTERFKSVCSLWLTEDDREALVQDGFLEANYLSTGEDVVAVGGMLRLATIDNFQGEESKVVFLSTVRSNIEDRVGFLKTTNRINVACSRARDGFYIIGNASLMDQVPMWHQIIEEMKSHHWIERYFRACCPRHRSNITRVAQPNQWLTIPQCKIPCGFIFPCQHRCQMTCHASTIHDRQGCLEPCEKIHEACGHACEKACGKPCGDCKAPVSKVTLSCGHEATITCSDFREGKSAENVVCEVIIGSQELACGHTQNITCAAPNDAGPCTEPCNQILDCGHRCVGICGNCQSNDNHPACKVPCRTEMKCGHNCGSTCHIGECPPCKLPCERGCVHRSCKKRCSEDCDPCTRPCDWKCDHQGPCGTVCCLPCNKLPCSEPCTRILMCGHLCSGLCGETCGCLECLTGVFTSTTHIFLTCGHNFEVAVLDRKFGLERAFNLDKNGQILAIRQARARSFTNSRLVCPTCGSRCKDIRRYALLEQLCNLPEIIDRVLHKFSRKTRTLLKRMSQVRVELDRTFDQFCRNIRPGPLAAKDNEALVLERGNAMSEVENQIFLYKGEIVEPFEKAMRSLIAFWNTPESLANCLWSSSIRLESLHLRCKLIALEENIRMSKHVSTLAKQSQHMKLLHEGLRRVRIPQILSDFDNVNSMIDHCRERRLRRLEAELRLCRESSRFARSTIGDHDAVSSSEVELRQILSFCERYSQAAGHLLPACQTMRSVLIGHRTQTHGLYNRNTVEAWWTWPVHEVGDLKRCENGHPFSAITQPQCLECGLGVKVPQKPTPSVKLCVDATEFMEFSNSNSSASNAERTSTEHLWGINQEKNDIKKLMDWASKKAGKQSRGYQTLPARLRSENQQTRDLSELVNWISSVKGQLQCSLVAGPEPSNRRSTLEQQAQLTSATR